MVEIAWSVEKNRYCLEMWKIGGDYTADKAEPTIKANIPWLHGDHGFEFPLGWITNKSPKVAEHWVASRAVVLQHEDSVLTKKHITSSWLKSMMSWLKSMVSDL